MTSLTAQLKNSCILKQTSCLWEAVTYFSPFFSYKFIRAWEQPSLVLPREHLYQDNYYHASNWLKIGYYEENSILCQGIWYICGDISYSKGTSNLKAYETASKLKCIFFKIIELFDLSSLTDEVLHGFEFLIPDWQFYTTSNEIHISPEHLPWGRGREVTGNFTKGVGGESKIAHKFLKQKNSMTDLPIVQYGRG